MNDQHPDKYADWEEMLFEEREQGYGAYELRRKYPKRLMIALGLASALFLSTTLGPYVWMKAFGNNIEPNLKKTIATVIELDAPPEIETPQDPPPPTPPPSVTPPVAMVAHLIPEPSPEVEDTATLVEISVLEEAPNIGLDNIEGEDREEIFTGEVDFDGEGFNVIKEETAPDPGIFIAPDEQPKPLNMKDIQKLIGYPPLARETGLEGTVVLRVLVDKKGHYKDHIVINSAHPILSKAVERKIPLLKFTPAIQGKKPILFWVNIPFVFNLQD